ncbi:MAG: DUF3540 domain-containing protein [Myxococcales bacterium]|nr:DUF3540 domain-containing protein [Myxococcales bacterium]
MNAPFETPTVLLPLEAEVARVYDEGGERWAELRCDDEPLQARVAAGVTLDVGAVALFLHAASGQAYVIAGFGASPQAPRLELADGTTASVDRGARDEPVLRVVSAAGETLFEYDPVRGEGTVCLGQQDLRVSVGGKLTLHGDRGLELSSAGAVALEGDTLAMQGRHADVALDSVDVRAKRVLNRIDHLKSVIDLWETTAGRIVERARDALRETEGLTQTRAGRLRLIAQTSLHTLAERTVVVSRGDTKLKGNRIHLG